MAEQPLLDLWLPPAGAGDPIALLASSFAFDTDFFRDECLSRFLGMRTAADERHVSRQANLSELEERLANITASVLVDRRASVESRTLRWDLNPVSYDKGYLHTKTTMLLWSNAARIIIGSANLTVSGYRYNREVAVAFDLITGTPTPRSLWVDYADEWRRILDLLPPDATVPGPRSRAEGILSLFRARIATVKPPASAHGMKVKLVPSRPGRPALPQLTEVMAGHKPRHLKALSPYWDSRDQGDTTDAVRAITGLLASTGDASAELLVRLEVNQHGQLVQAPQDLPARSLRPGIATTLHGVDDRQDDATRHLHAKMLTVESDDWVTVMMGSSNMTTAGLGLARNRGHIEMNVAFGAASTSKAGRYLRSLQPPAALLSVTDEKFVDVGEDVDFEEVGQPLPAGFLSATLTHSDSLWSLILTFDPDKLPAAWTVSLPAGTSPLADAATAMPVARLDVAQLPQDALPQRLVVAWTTTGGASETSDWAVNVDDPSFLPVDEQLKDIDVSDLVQALAQRATEPHLALGQILSHKAFGDDAPLDSEFTQAELDPLRRFSDSGALLRSMTVYGRALDELTRRLERPCGTASALGWRLGGVLSPARLAEGWAKQCADGKLERPVAHFLLAELQLVMARVDWPTVTHGLDQQTVATVMSTAQARWIRARDSLPPLATGSVLNRYVNESQALHASQ